MTEFVDVPTKDLTGEALNYSVAQIEGVKYIRHYISVGAYHDGKTWSQKTLSNYKPSSDWSHGGPLITKYQMDFCCEHPETIGSALCDENGMYIDGWMMFGKTHLIAACRAIVAHKIGDSVSVPKELTNV